MKPLIVGEVPGKGGDATKPIEGRVDARLAACSGLQLTEFLQLFDRINLLQEQPQDAPKGMAFNVKAAGRVARELERTFTPGMTVVLLGKRVGAAFGMTKTDYFDWFALNHAKAVIVPHPSGASRWWNALDNELQMIKFMHKLVKELKDGERLIGSGGPDSCRCNEYETCAVCL